MDTIAIYFSSESDSDENVSPHLLYRSIRDKSNIYEQSDAISSRIEKNNENDSLQKTENQVDKYKDVLERITKKLTSTSSSLSSSSGSNQAEIEEKKCKKINEYRIAVSMEESAKDLHNGPFRDILEQCAKTEKNIAIEMLNHEGNIETHVTKKLSLIIDNHITSITKQRRVVSKLVQDYESTKHKLQSGYKVNDSIKISQLKDELEDIETKLEKERDILAAEMYDLIKEEENMSNYVFQYMKLQQAFYTSALQEISQTMTRVQDNLKKYNWRVFKVPLEEHLLNSDRTISYVIELCCCYLMERGLTEEGLLRIGCASSKLRRIRSAIDAKIFTDVLPVEYQDVHVMAGLLKSYLRDLPEPLLTYRLYPKFSEASVKPSENQRKTAILNTINELPREHYNNLRYLTNFLSRLSQHHQQNKMSTQNIAIVMSPNLLWPPNQNDADYVMNVSSTATVNTIVESLISDWNFYFQGDVNFYSKLNKETLFQEIYGLVNDRELGIPPNFDNNISKMNVTYNNNNNNISMMSTSVIDKPTSGTNPTIRRHSKSNSHDTSLIILSMDDMKRSQSNSSLSDQSSPKLAPRRKHNKQAAPTPPDHHQFKEPNRINNNNNTNNNTIATTKTKLDEKYDDLSINHSLNKTVPERPPQPQIHREFDSVEDLSKCDKPPKPVVSTETQTLNRSTYKMPKPKALPRSSIVPKNNVDNFPDDTSVLLRNRKDSGERLEKPAIPERPASLVRPINLRSNSQDLINQTGFDLTDCQNSVKKTQSFRSNQTATKTNNNSTTALGSGGAQTTLERTHIYNVDKQQVAYIDLDENTLNKMKEFQAQQNDFQLIDSDGPFVDSPNETLTYATQVPPSPRGFDPKVKRPQIPAPPPPNRPKSSDGNSTNL